MRLGEGGENWNWVPDDEDELELDEDEIDDWAERGRNDPERDAWRKEESGGEERAGGGGGAVSWMVGRMSAGSRPAEVVGRLGRLVDPRRSVVGVGFGRVGMSTGSV